ncbi:MAG: PKD domain-containing protein [Saprospirales bacterium]|nr:PKD domain-containing protein [Saprospirales bacterium]
MKRLFSLLSFLLILFSASAQFPFPPLMPEDPNMPEWALDLYSESPNAYEIDRAFKEYYQAHPFEKNVHTQYYKRWRRFVAPYVKADGFIHWPTVSELKAEQDRRLALRTQRGGPEWSSVGPDIHLENNGDSLFQVSEQSNIYTIDRSMSDPDILFCGGESGGVYKTTDQGQNWTFVSRELNVTSIGAIRIHPQDPDFVLFGAAGQIWKTTDGGLSWEITGQPAFQAIDVWVNEIAYNPADPNVIYAATNEGFFRSEDGAGTWDEILPNNCTSVDIKPGDPAVVYVLHHNPTLNIAQFHKSVDFGQTFTVFDTGWFLPEGGDLGQIENLGGDLAVTEADPNRVYALLVGYGNANTTLQPNGFIGVYVSYDAGETWSLPHGIIGAPYTPPNHPNLMNFTGDDGTYTQIHYNTTLAASQLDPDHILIGGLCLYKSEDAGATFTAMAGYVGYVPHVHVDMQEIRTYKTSDTTEELWLSNDGGIHHSTDLMEHHEARNRGIHGGSWWYFDQGWNEDMMVGGRYHNGNAAFHENYPEKTFLALGGGEAGTGYLNYSGEQKAYFSDIGGRYLPDSIHLPVGNFSMSAAPNESYWAYYRSNMVFDSRYYNVTYIGKENRILRSIDGGSAYSEWHAFGSDPTKWVLGIEQSRFNPDVFYAQQEASGQFILWRTENGGQTWQPVSIPYASWDWGFALSASDPDELWVAYLNGANGSKVYHSQNGGDSWENWTSPQLDGVQVSELAHQPGTDGGLYIGTFQGDVFYRNNSMSEWAPMVSNLPISVQALRIVPFIRDGKLRMATWTHSIWEIDLFEPSELIADFGADFATFYCPGDTVQFANHSVAPAGANYSWSFPGAIPSSATGLYPKVVYPEDGVYDVTLAVTFNGQTASATKQALVSNSEVLALDALMEGFEAGSLPEAWRKNGNGSWVASSDAGGYDLSNFSMRFDNFWYDAGGQRDEIWTSRHSASNWTNLVLTFDVAYAEYGFPYSDTLAVLVTADCGQNMEEVYVKGGDDLQTAPDFQEYFIPTADQWRTDTILLAQYSESPALTIIFQNRGHWGNVVYVDNINMQAEPSTVTAKEPFAMTSSMRLSPNPAQGQCKLELNGVGPEGMEIRLLNTLGQSVRSLQATPAANRLDLSLDLQGLASGHYVVECRQEGRSWWGKIIISQ